LIGTNSDLQSLLVRRSSGEAVVGGLLGTEVLATFGRQVLEKLQENFTDAEIRKVMGGNIIPFHSENLPSE